MNIKASSQLLIIIMAFVMPLQGFAQDPTSFKKLPLDSLEKINEAYTKQDLTKLTLLNQLTLSYKTRNPQKGIETGEHAISLALQLKNPSMTGEAYHNKGLIHFSKGEYEQSIALNESALELHSRLNNKNEIAVFTYYIGEIYKQKGDHKKALDLFEKAIVLFEDTKNIAGTAQVYYERGLLYTEFSNYPKALQYLQKALDINYQLGDKNAIGLSLRKIGNVYVSLADYPKAMECYQRALDMVDESVDIDVIAKIYSMMGGAYSNISNFLKSLEYYQKGLEFSIQSGDKENIIHGLRNMGHVYGNMNDYHKSLEYYQKALTINEELGYKPDLAVTLGNMANAYIRLSEYNNALEYCQKALQINEQIGNKNFIAQDLSNMGSVYHHLRDQNKAVEYYSKAINLYEELGNLNNMAGDYNSIGRVYYSLSDYPKALEYYHKALEISEKLKIKSKIADNLGSIGNIYRDATSTDLQLLGINPADRYVLALKYHTQSQIIASEIGELSKEKDSWWNLKLTYEKQKDYAKAYEAFKTYIILRDSIQGEETKKQFVRKEIQYEYDKREAEFKFQQQLTDEQLQKQQILNRQQRKSYLLFGVVILGMAGLLATRLWYERRDAARLKELDKFKTKLYTNITHEFRTPLTVISGVASELKDNKAMLDSGVQSIQRNSARLLHLVNQMLDLSKLQSGALSIHLVNGDIVKYTSYVVQSFQSFADSRRIQLHILPAMPIFKMDYDAEKILQILSNLISNAIKFTPSDGNVYIHLSTLKTKGIEQFQLKVQDTGIGIAEENLTHIFDRFYQIDEDYRSDKGTGIGLALVKELVQLLGGSIQVQSVLKKGTEFVVTLPVTREAPDEAADYQRPSVREIVESFTPIYSNGTPLNLDVNELNETPRLLIIEDTPDVIHYLRMCLEKVYRITEAHDGREGIDIAIETIPDIIITDVMMPVKDGYEVCRTLKEDERTSHIPIIMLTARADTPSKLEGLRTGADAYLFKPFEKEELLIRIQKLLELRARLQQYYSNSELNPALKSEGMEKEDQFIQKLKEVIYSHLDDDDFGITEICGVMNLSRTQLHYKIKALTGRSTSLYLRLIRLQQAKKLLTETKLQVAEVAYSTGFRDPAYFSRCFAEDFGMSPSEFRNGLSRAV